MASTAATASPATVPTTDDAWKAAQKSRAAILKELEIIQNGGPGTNEIARFEKVEKLMETYRLRCIETIWLDIRASKEKGAEDALWQVHSNVTKAYRKVLARSQGNDHVVLRRKLEKLYAAYLKTAQYFYRGYLQRTCARYDMKDLRRIARQADLEEMPVPDQDKVDPAAAQLQDIVKSSCHKTLIYLGDLARYRTLLRSKDRKWDGALSYYLLANELIPESGYGHHQCGVIYVETEDHLEVVYHLYRALACAQPHPNAPLNLEREFRELQKRKKSTGIKHALVNWFVKLHAFYSQGKEFAERKELESEVDHRLAVALKSGTGYGSEVDLLKIILINITAYVTAQDKIRAKWTDERSSSCQFLLLLNIRTIHAIARLLGEEFAGLIKLRAAEAPAAVSEANAETTTQSTTKFTPAVNRVLPLLRVYMAWLCSCAPQLVEFRPHLEPQFGTMCTTLSNTLSLLFDLLGSEPPLGTPVSWRFPEDEMTMGIDCLNGPDLHDGCRLYYDPFTRQPKPRLEDVADDTHTADDVTFTRGLDVMLCALDLSALESRFPFTTSATAKGTRQLTTFVFLEGGKPDNNPSLPEVQHPTPTTALNIVNLPHQRLMVAPSPCESNELSEDREFYGPNLRKAGNGAYRGSSRPAAVPAQATPASEYPIEKQLFQILNDFMAPPEAPRETKPETPTRPHARTESNGLGSAAAAESYSAGSSTSPAPGSAGMKRIPTLPWDYFYTPAPVDATLRNAGASGSGAGWGANGTGFSRPVSSGNAAQLGTSVNASNPLARQSHQRYASTGRASLMDDQADVLRSLDLESDQRVSQPLQGQSVRDAWSRAAAAETLNASHGLASNPNPLHQQYQQQQQNLWGGVSSANPWQATYGQPPAASTALPNSPFSTLDFSANASSSLPQVNSPWGLPTTTTTTTTAATTTAAQRFAATHSPSPPNPLLASYLGGASLPSPSGNNRFASAYEAALARAPTPLASVWSDAQQPRSGSGSGGGVNQVSSAGGAGGAGGGKVDGKGWVVQGLPKR